MTEQDITRELAEVGFTLHAQETESYRAAYSHGAAYSNGTMYLYVDTGLTKQCTLYPAPFFRQVAGVPVMPFGGFFSVADCLTFLRAETKL